ncbi:MAG: amidohydrolase family protein [Myxococcota bacterium]|nr:amidohydrolase family protein [Myxococcota bacterium]
MRVRFSVVMSALCLSLVAPSDAIAQSGCVLLEGATVWLPQGESAPSTVLVQDEKIVSVTAPGTTVKVPDGCERVDGSGQILTPGFVDPYTQLGLVEVGMEAASRDHSPGAGTVGKLSTRPSFRVWPAYNPRSTLIPIARSGGVTGVLAAPRGGRVSGQSVWVDLIEPTPYAADALPEPSPEKSAGQVPPDAVAIHVHLGANDGSRAEAHWDLELLLEEARVWSERRSQWERNQHRAFRFPASELEAMQPILDRTRILAVHAERATDIEGALKACSGLRCVLVGGAEAWILAERLAQSGVTVVLDPLLNAPESFDRLQARPDNAAILADAGVQVALSTFSSHNVRTLRQGAGNAVRAGLSQRAARMAVTEIPANAFGRTQRGRIAPGAVANLVLWSGDPFEFSSEVKRMWIRGAGVDLSSRQTRLRDRYRKLPGTPSSALPLP